jgi:hypothetical protein
MRPDDFLQLLRRRSGPYLAEYERRRAAYVRAGHGTPPPGATPLPADEAAQGGGEPPVVG